MYEINVGPRHGDRERFFEADELINKNGISRVAINNHAIASGLLPSSSNRINFSETKNTKGR